LFDSETAAAAAARALRELGLRRERVSIVARTHALEGRLATASGASPGSEIEDSPAASIAGELSGYVLAAVALVLPGIGPIVAGGPLGADLGETAGHLAGGIARALERAGVAPATAEEWERRVGSGAVLVGAHVDAAGAGAAMESLARHGAADVSKVSWPGELG
jgi:hypothetical protein